MPAAKNGRTRPIAIGQLRILVVSVVRAVVSVVVDSIVVIRFIIISIIIVGVMVGSIVSVVVSAIIVSFAIRKQGILVLLLLPQRSYFVSSHPTLMWGLMTQLTASASASLTKICMFDFILCNRSRKLL